MSLQQFRIERMGKKADEKTIKLLFVPLIIYGIALAIDVIVTMIAYVKLGSGFFDMELNPITSFFIEHFHFPFNLFIPYIVILLFFHLTCDRYEHYNADKKLWYVTGILCYSIAMSAIHIYGCSGGIFGGWLF